MQNPVAHQMKQAGCNGPIAMLPVKPQGRQLVLARATLARAKARIQAVTGIHLVSGLEIVAGGPGSGRHPWKTGEETPQVLEKRYSIPKGVSGKTVKTFPLPSGWKQHKNWKQQAYGGVLVNEQGQFLLREPANHFDGYAWTWPKGKMDNPEEHPVDTALREVGEETGHSGRVFAPLQGNYKSASGSNNNFYLMRSVNTIPDATDRETRSTHWATYKEAKGLINQSKNKAGRDRDLAILKEAHNHIQHFRDVSAEGIDAGGVGSGCHGPNCGRPPGTAQGVMKYHGWKKIGDTPEKMTFKHPAHGLIDYFHKAVGGGKQFAHYGPGNNMGGPATHSGYNYKGSKALHDYISKVMNPGGYTQPVSISKVATLENKLTQTVNQMYPAPKTPFDGPEVQKPTVQGDTTKYSYKGLPSSFKSSFTGYEYHFNGKNYVHSGNTEGLNGKLPKPVGLVLESNKYGSVKPLPATTIKNNLATGKFISTDPNYKPPTALKPIVNYADEPRTKQINPTQDKGSGTGAFFSLKPDQPSLGGAHEKYVYQDKDKADWLFKPAQTLSGTPDPMKALVDEAASKIQGLVRPTAAVEAKAMTVSVPGGGLKYGSMQKMVTNVASATGFKGVPVNQISSDHIKQLQQEQVVDWLISNHDAHAAQFVTTNDGKVLGIDKTQAFKHFPDDKLDSSYHPNAAYGEQPPIYNNIMKAAKTGLISLDPNAALPAIKNAQSISDKDYKTILTPYAEARFSDTKSRNDFLTNAVARKDNLKSDFEKMYADVLKKPDFKFDTSSMYPPKPDKVTQEMHEALIDKGYTFEKYGAKTGNALYKENGEHAGKAVYVTDSATNKWTYYPMGTQGTNPYGSSEGTGVKALKEKVAEPFEKPGSHVTAPTSTKSSTQSNALTPEQQAKLNALPTVNWVAETTGQPTAVVDTTHNFTQTELHVMGDYKGSGYHNINGFLWGGGEAAQNDKIKAMDSALTKSKTNQDIVVWRNPGSSKYAYDVQKYLLDGAKEHTPQCFQSTSTSKQFAQGWASYGSPVVFQIHVPKGSPALAWNSEHELMLDRNVVYHVNKLFKSGDKLYADVNAVFMPKKSKTVSSSKSKTKSTSEEWGREFRQYATPEEAEQGMASCTMKDDTVLKGAYPGTVAKKTTRSKQ